MQSKLILSLVFVALFAGPLVAQDVVGYHRDADDFFVAVRGIVPANTTINGVRFYSNDATVFPEVALIADAGEKRLPSMTETLRSTTLVSAQPGYVQVSFDPLTIGEDEFLWILVRFPTSGRLTASGLGGGPGIGWNDTRTLKSQRSFFSVDANLNEFERVFDIKLLTVTAGKGGVTTQSSSGSVENLAPAAVPEPPRTMLTRVVPNPANPSASIEFSLANDVTVLLDLYNVAGRHIRTLASRRMQSGDHTVTWNGRNKNGAQVATGIYVVSFRAGGVSSTMKIILVR